MARTTLQDIKAEMLQDPEFREAYDGLEEEFALARQIIAARIRANMTQEEVAQKMNTTQSVIARMESGKHLPSTKSLLKYAAATDSKLEIQFSPREKTHW